MYTYDHILIIKEKNFITSYQSIDQEEDGQNDHQESEQDYHLRTKVNNLLRKTL